MRWLRASASSGSGFVLLVVLGTLAVLAALATTFVGAASLERAIGANYAHHIRARLRAESGVEYAIARLEPSLGRLATPAMLRMLTHTPGGNASLPLPQDPTVSFRQDFGAVRESCRLEIDMEDGKLNLNDSNGAWNIDTDPHPDGDAAADADDIAAARPRLRMLTAALANVLLNADGTRPDIAEAVADALFPEEVETRNPRFSSMEEIQARLVPGILNAEEYERFARHITLHSWQDPRTIRPTFQYRASVPDGAGLVPERWAHQLFLWSDWQTREFAMEPRCPVNVNLASTDLLEALIRPLQSWYLVEGPGSPISFSMDGIGWLTSGSGNSIFSSQYHWRDLEDSQLWGFDTRPGVTLEAASRYGQPFLTPDLDRLLNGQFARRFAALLHERIHADGAENPVETWEEMEYVTESILEALFPDTAADLSIFWEDWTSPQLTHGIHGPAPYRMRDVWTSFTFEIINFIGGTTRVGAYERSPGSPVPPGVDMPYWTRYCRDVLRDLLLANFNPNSRLNDCNSDRHLHRHIDKAQLTRYTTELAFVPCGRFRVVSHGVVAGDAGAVLARQTVDAVIELSAPWRLTTQAQFTSGLQAPDNISAAAPAAPAAWNTAITSYPEPLLRRPDGAADGRYLTGSHADGYLMPSTRRVDANSGYETLVCRMEGRLDADTPGNARVHTIPGQFIDSGGRYSLGNAPTTQRLTRFAGADDAIGSLLPDGALSDAGRGLNYPSSAIGSDFGRRGALAFWIKPNFDTRCTSRPRTLVGWNSMFPSQRFSFEFLPHQGIHCWETHKEAFGPILLNQPTGGTNGFSSYGTAWNPSRNFNINCLALLGNTSYGGMICHSGVISPTVTRDYPNQLFNANAALPDLPRFDMRAVHHSYYFEPRQWSHIVLGWDLNGSPKWAGPTTSLPAYRFVMINGRNPIVAESASQGLTVHNPNDPVPYPSPDAHVRFGDASGPGNNFTADCTFDEIVAYVEYGHGLQGSFSRTMPLSVEQLYRQRGRYVAPATPRELPVYLSPAADPRRELQLTGPTTVLSVAWTAYWPKHNLRVDCLNNINETNPALVENDALLPLNVNDTLAPDPLAEIYGQDSTWTRRHGPRNLSGLPAAWGWRDAGGQAVAYDPISVDIARVDPAGHEHWMADTNGDGDVFDDHEHTLCYAGASPVSRAVDGGSLRLETGEQLRLRVYFNIAPGQVMQEAPALDDITLYLRVRRVLSWSMR